MSKNKINWTPGKGIAVAGKWIAIAVMFAVLLSFINNRLREDCYYDERMPIKPEVEQKGCIGYCATLLYPNGTIIKTTCEDT